MAAAVLRQPEDCRTGTHAHAADRYSAPVDALT
jgi:hypothetical protein